MDKPQAVLKGTALSSQGRETGEDARLVLETAMEAGHLLLENGAEIFRVEETMTRICRHFGVEDSQFFVLSNGIFTTGGYSRQFAKVQHIPVKGTRLDKVVAVNQLSREIESGKYTPEEVRRELERIRRMPDKPLLLQFLASGVGSAAFCCLFGGTLAEGTAAFIAGFFLYIFMKLAAFPHLSRIMAHILGGAMVTAICLTARHFGLGERLNPMIIGAIIPLVPGVSFTNGIRDIADGDYISGSVRLLDAILVIVSVAIGVGIVLTAVGRLGGGALWK